MSYIRNIEDLFKMAASRPMSVVSVAVCADLHVLEACVAAYEKKIANFILVGNADKTREIAVEHNIDISAFEIINELDNNIACQKAVELVKSGRASAIMKGLIDTPVIMRAVLNRENGIRTGRKLSHMAAFELAHYHKLLFITDAAINIAPNTEDRKQIIQNAVIALNNLGLQTPKVALLAANEKADEKMPVTLECAELVKMHQEGDFGECDMVMDGPLALDNAVSKESCQIKGINSPIGGDADLLIAPDIEAGNILYKALAFLAGARNGGVVLGALRPVILTSRADSADSKLISIALSVLF